MVPPAKEAPRAPLGPSETLTLGTPLDGTGTVSQRFLPARRETCRNISSQLRSHSKERVTNLLLKREGSEDRWDINGGHIELYNEILKLEEQRNKSLPSRGNEGILSAHPFNTKRSFPSHSSVDTIDSSAIHPKFTSCGHAVPAFLRIVEESMIHGFWCATPQLIMYHWGSLSTRAWVPTMHGAVVLGN